MGTKIKSTLKRKPKKPEKKPTDASTPEGKNMKFKKVAHSVENEIDIQNAKQETKRKFGNTEGEGMSAKESLNKKNEEIKIEGERIIAKENELLEKSKTQEGIPVYGQDKIVIDEWGEERIIAKAGTPIPINSPDYAEYTTMPPEAQLLEKILLYGSGSMGVTKGATSFLKTANKLKTYTPKAGNSQLAMFMGKDGVIRVGNNAKTFGLQKNILLKLASQTKNPIIIMGILTSTLYTSLFWAPNEKGDALTTLTIVQKEALRNGDVEAVNKIGEMIEEVYNISASIPVIGFIKSEIAKFKAAKIASETYMKAAEKIAVGKSL